MAFLSVHAGLFFIAFLSATLLPAQSEALLVLLLNSGKYSFTALIATASMGNILGSLTNWVIGRKVEQYKHHKWFPCSAKTLEKAQSIYQKYGRWCLLLSWVPIIGDPLTVAAGVMKERFWPFFLIVGFAKTARYAVLALFVL